jgi:hypothetical protein
MVDATCRSADTRAARDGLNEALWSRVVSAPSAENRPCMGLLPGQASGGSPWDRRPKDVPASRPTVDLPGQAFEPTLDRHGTRSV